MIKRSVKIFLVFVIIFVPAFHAAESPADASIASWQKSASIVPTSPQDFSSSNFRQSLQDLKDTNANHVTLIIPYYQSSIHSVDIHRGWNTPADESLISAIRYAHSLGLNVSLKLHMETNDGQWRAYINPSDRDGWFNAYSSVLYHYADIAQQEGVEQLVIGAEMISMASENVNSSNTQYWIDIINNLRSRFSGSLTYSANWGPPSNSFVNEKDHIGFWPHLDYIGIAAYFELGQDWSRNDVESFKQEWDRWNNSDIRPLHDRYGKPILFTEIGYRSVDGAHTDPWNSGRGGGFNETEQTNAYEALFSYWNTQPYMQGVSLWDWKSWPGAGGQGNTDYTPQNKQAEEVMRSWFGQMSNGEEPPPPPSASSFEISGTFDPSSLAIGESTDIFLNVKPIEANAQNVIVDIEVHNDSGQKVFQEFFEGQNIPQGTVEDYSVPWQPNDSGNFTMKAGVFSSGWGSAHEWNNSVDTITVSEGSEPPEEPAPEPGPGEVEVWWPGDGVTISGTQPFKGLLKNFSLGQYKMFWQVDGDRLNEMHDSQEDYPHKESLVDVSGWNWRSAGSSYALNFVAQGLDGSFIANKLINIFVSN